MLHEKLTALAFPPNPVGVQGGFSGWCVTCVPNGWTNVTSSGKLIGTLRLGATVIASILPLAATSALASVDNSRVQDADFPLCEASQDGGKTLEEAIRCVRNQGNVDHILQAETRVEGGRAVHYIMVITNKKTVRTYKIFGRMGGPTLHYSEWSYNHSAIKERLLLAATSRSTVRMLNDCC